MSKSTIKWIFIFLLLMDLSYSFRQHYGMSLDGDMAAIILPADWYRQVLEDPFGVDVLFSDASYGGTGRFFCHWSISAFYNNIPLAFHSFIDPIKSIYFSTALIKTIIQLIFIWMLALFVSRKRKLLRIDFLLAAILIAPLLQTHGYNLIIGVIEKAPTYFFFYSMPLALLCLFLFPYFFSDGIKKQLWTPILLILALFLPFSSPILPAVVLVGILILLLKMLIEWKGGKRDIEKFFNVCKEHLLLLLPLLVLIVLSIYSMWLGRHNSEQAVASIPVDERYYALLHGLYMQLSQKLAYPLLLSAIGVNLYIMKKLAPDESRNVRNVIKWVAVFSVVYLMLLPLGGFREYRSLIVRHDTMMPVTLCVFYIFGASSYFLTKINDWKFSHFYKIGISIFLLMFTIADSPNFNYNFCEKAALNKISKSSESLIILEKGCNIMAWDHIGDPDDSWLNMQLLKKWKVVNEEKLFYQQ